MIIQKIVKAAEHKFSFDFSSLFFSFPSTNVFISMPSAIFPAIPCCLKVLINFMQISTWAVLESQTT